jgi:hypothetical protein
MLLQKGGGAMSQLALLRCRDTTQRVAMPGGPPIAHFDKYKVVPLLHDEVNFSAWRPEIPRDKPKSLPT